MFVISGVTSPRSKANHGLGFELKIRGFVKPIHILRPRPAVKENKTGFFKTKQFGSMVTVIGEINA